MENIEKIIKEIISAKKSGIVEKVIMSIDFKEKICNEMFIFAQTLVNNHGSYPPTIYGIPVEYTYKNDFEFRLKVKPNKKPKCIWTQQDDEDSTAWETGCGYSDFVEDVLPSNHDYSFCHFCGGELVEKTYTSLMDDFEE